MTTAPTVAFASTRSPSYSHKSSYIYSSSSDEGEDSADEQSCYNADQIRAKRRASSRISFSLNKDISKAVSQYSDDEEEEKEGEQCEKEEQQKTTLKHCRRISDSIKVSKVMESDDEEADNLDCKLLSGKSPIGSSISLNIHGDEHNNVVVVDEDVDGKCNIPITDRNSRSRCFEYLVGAIDEAWARYCDATTHVEDEVYGYDTPRSVATDDEDNLFDNTTDMTDYEDSDFENHHEKPQQQQVPPTLPTAATFRRRLSSTSSMSSSKDDPSSCQLQELKNRLTKAKYYLQDLVDSDDYDEVASFWKRWDMIKYATIELVEDDDEDEIIESTIDELEAGRLFVN
ncbi:hypothetical protein JA1_002780 [Spathaspora sp. JA1]|nr:hypothetical protein JA1_002780 [Spathaspora sp. JA1]